MAFVPVGVNTTLAQFKERVRAQSNTISPQESGVIEPELTNLIHAAVVQIRATLDKLVDQHYAITETVTEDSNLIDISTKDISDINRITLYDATHGAVPLVTSSDFDSLLTVFKNTTLATEYLFGCVKNILSGGDNKLCIKTARGTSKATPGTLTLTYPRNPVKATLEAGKIDLPEKYIPAAQDLATTMVYRKLMKTPPVDVDRRLSAFMQAQAAMLGLKVEPT